MGMSSPKKSAPTIMNKPPRPPPPKPLRLPSRSKPMSKWSPSANPDTMDMVDTDTEDTDTTTARRSLKPPPTTCPLSPPSTSPSKSNTPAPSRPVSTNPSTSPSLAAKTSSKSAPSPFPSALLDLENLPAKRLSSPSPNKSVSNLSTDTLMSPHPLPPLMLPLLRNKNLANDQNLCRSIAQGCFQVNYYISIFILLFMPSSPHSTKP